MAHSGAATRRQTRADAGLLKRLVPPASIGWDDFHALALGTALEQLPAGTVVFREGDADPDVVYLVSGAIEVGSSSGTAQLVEAGSDLARQPLAEAEPRQAGARAATAVTLLRIDRAKARSVAEARALIDVDELSLDEADPLPSCDAYRADWMSTLLRSPILGRLEPTAVQRLLSCLHEVGVRAGEVVVRQGEPADGLCIVVSGTCTMTRTTHGGAALVLDRLEEGASFGAEAILLDAPQPATVTMDTDGRLLRLDAERFRTLLAAPLLTECDGAAATHLLRLGAIPLDVRQSTAGGGPRSPTPFDCPGTWCDCARRRSIVGGPTSASATTAARARRLRSCSASAVSTPPS